MRIRTLLLATPAAVALLVAPTAHADWRGGHGYGPHYGYPYHGGGYHGGGGVGVVAGALLGLGVGAVIAGALAPPVYVAPPPVVYAPPPVMYAAPPVMYAPAPRVVYAPAPAYYGW